MSTRPCGCPSAGVIHVDQTVHQHWHDTTGGPLCPPNACLCGQCDGYAEQQRLLQLAREQAWQARVAKEGKKWAEQQGAAA